jgi:hypothetical protein
MRATTLVVACVLMVSSAFAAEPQVAPVAAASQPQTETPAIVWSLEMSCCQAQ